MHAIAEISSMIPQAPSCLHRTLLPLPEVEYSSKWQEANLEELSEGLYEGELEVLWQASHVVVGLDHVAVLLVLAGWRHGLYDIWIQRSLRHRHTGCEAHSQEKGSMP